MVTRQRGRRRGTLAFAVVAVLVAAALFMWLRSSDVFAVERITSTAVEHLSDEDISRATVDARGTSLLRLSTKAIEERLAALPYVRSVQVHRRFPDTLEISLVEYEPVARLQGEDGDMWLVASDGRILEKTSAGDLPLLVAAAHMSPTAGHVVPGTIAGALPLAALLLEQDVAASLPALDRIEVSRDGRVVIALDGGGELRLGFPTELKQKLTVAVAIVERCLRDGKQLRYIDASTPDRVAVNHK